MMELKATKPGKPATVAAFKSSIKCSRTDRWDTSFLAFINSLYQAAAPISGKWPARRSRAARSRGVPLPSCGSKFLESRRITPASKIPISAGNVSDFAKYCSVTKVHAEPKDSSRSTRASGYERESAWWSSTHSTLPEKTSATIFVILLWSVSTNDRVSNVRTTSQSTSSQNLIRIGLPSAATSEPARRKSDKASPRRRNSSRGICARATACTSALSRSAAMA
mmetsp:Transcript_58217/g.151667  ORF Transcript_58217/g.151667 Transcript_58217/m.151667 type:complete len:223 (-) Transcript_58217:92-760(-)